ncbi:WD40 repeat-like protein [Meira miltonrushii]|uniref:WD40 repeat-like protein n=1 Tax=Meira miltonrushii TaxID=1280837 RepID=A0A316V1Y9_9BASI|nr:WD40 repeat-like protein [Meira miltonrushii]PWN31482.1 WD40 repeat-like protein [Meira miltonrushii]
MEFRKTGTFASLQPQTFQSNPEARYWQQFSSPIFIKEFAPINAINFVPTTGIPSSSNNDLASLASKQKFSVTSATRVQVFNMRTVKATKVFSRFKDVARSGTFRSDGKLLVAGDDSGLVQVFDAQSKSVLRQLKGHELPVHSVKFSCDPTKIASASDDRTVRLWDMPEEKEQRIFTNHQDYVRSVLVSPDNANLLLSGSYDSTVRLWDARMAENGGCAITMHHGAPVEDVLIFPTGGGGAALSAGGPILRSWDLMMGGKCRHAVSNHSKTITSLAISMTSGAEASAETGLGGIRVLTAGLDQLVKVYDPEKEYKVVHTMRYSAPILCMGISPDESQIVTGMADGTLCIRKRNLAAAESQHRRLAAQNGQTLQYFLPSGSTQNPASDGLIPSKKEAKQSKVQKERQKLRTHDKLLKAFRYRDALDEVLRKGVRTDVTFAVLDELRNRSTIDANGNIILDGLRRAISGRDDVTLEPLLRFFLRHSANARWTPIVCDCMDVIMDVYAPVLGQSPVIDELFGKIWSKISEEIDVQKQLTQVRGALEMILMRSAMT